MQQTSSTWYEQFIVVAVASAMSAFAIEASAQRGEPPVLVLPTLIEAQDPQALVTVSGQIENELRTQGIATLSMEDAVQQFRQNHSTEPLPSATKDLDALKTCAQRALFQVADGRRVEARFTAQRCVDRAEHAVESLNRESSAAEELLNSCLFMVRALLEMGDVNTAFTEAVQCRRLVPDIAPSEHMHPPEVRQLVQRAESELSSAPQSRLHATSTKPGCAVFLNGRRIGTTPLDIDRLFVGPYRVQVECDPGSPGRVHRLVIGARPVELHVDTDYERALVTEAGRLYLRYASDETQEDNRLAHAIETAKITHSREVWMTTTTSAPKTVRIDRVAVATQRVLGSAVFAIRDRGQASSRALAAAIFSLREGRSVNVSGADGKEEAMQAWAPPHPIVTPPEAPPPVVQRAQAPQRHRVTTPPPSSTRSSEQGMPKAVTWTMMGAGAAMVTAGWGLWGYRRHLIDSENKAPSNGSKYALIGVGFGGSALLSASFPWLLPRASRMPWWAWVSGGLGIGAISWGAISFATGNDCRARNEMGKCVAGKDDGGFGWIMTATAIPLLAVPMTYLVRSLLKTEHTAVTFEWDGGRGPRLEVQGVF